MPVHTKDLHHAILQVLRVLPHAISREALRTIGEKALLSLEIFKGLDPLLVRFRATLETTSGQMTPPKSGHPLECYLNQVAFPES